MGKKKTSIRTKSRTQATRTKSRAKSTGTSLIDQAVTAGRGAITEARRRVPPDLRQQVERIMTAATRQWDIQAHRATRSAAQRGNLLVKRLERLSRKLGERLADGTERVSGTIPRPTVRASATTTTRRRSRAKSAAPAENGSARRAASTRTTTRRSTTTGNGARRTRTKPAVAEPTEAVRHEVAIKVGET